MVTLVPLDAGDNMPSRLCVLCDGALADGVLNAAPFLPLGTTPSIVGWRPLRALLVGALLCLGLEATQLVIPGRDPSLTDVLFNTLGTALGIGSSRSPPSEKQARGIPPVMPIILARICSRRLVFFVGSGGTADPSCYGRCTRRQNAERDHFSSESATVAPFHLTLPCTPR
ncbi:MAG: VanZ family protein [Gammaproteobacteria bacterium]